MCSKGRGRPGGERERKSEEGRERRVRARRKERAGKTKDRKNTEKRARRQNVRNEGKR